MVPLVSASTDAAGPGKTRPSLSIERSSTSPLRKSAWVDTVQKVGVAARRPATIAAARKMETTTARTLRAKRRKRGRATRPPVFIGMG
jgi:hypothetical protein